MGNKLIHEGTNFIFIFFPFLLRLLKRVLIIMYEIDLIMFWIVYPDKRQLLGRKANGFSAMVLLLIG